MALETEFTLRAKDLASPQLKGVADGMDKITGAVTNASKMLLGFIGLTSIRSAYGMVAASAEMATQLDKTSERLGITIERLDAYRQIARQSGLEFDPLLRSMDQMSKNLTQAASGAGEAQADFVKLNLNAKELAKLKLEDQFLIIGEALSEIQDPSERTNDALKVLGERGVEVNKMFAKGATAVVEYAKGLEAAGSVMSSGMVKQMSALDMKLKDVEERFNRIKTEAIGATAPMAITAWETAQAKIQSQFTKFFMWMDDTPQANINEEIDARKRRESDRAWRAILSGKGVDSSMSNADAAAKMYPAAGAGGNSAFNIPGKVKINPGVSMPSFQGLLDLPGLGGEKQMYERASMALAAQADTFAQGWTNAIEEVKASFDELWGTAAAKGRTMALETSRAMASAFESIFFDAFEGHLQRLDQYVTQFLNSVAKSIMSMIAQQAANGIIMQIGGAMGGVFGASAAGTRGMPQNWNSSAIGAPGGGAPISRGKMRVEIINQSGVEMQGSQAYVRDDISGAVLGIIIDAAGRNKGGFRDALKGAMS